MYWACYQISLLRVSNNIYPFTIRRRNLKSQLYFLRLRLPSTTDLSRKRFCNNALQTGRIKKRRLCFSEGDDHMISLTEFESTANAKWTVIVVFWVFSALCGRKTVHAFSEKKMPFLNVNGAIKSGLFYDSDKSCSVYAFPRWCDGCKLIVLSFIIVVDDIG